MEQSESDQDIKPDEIAGLVAGTIVIILILFTFSVVLIVCLILWKRRRNKSGESIKDT